MSCCSKTMHQVPCDGARVCAWWGCDRFHNSNGLYVSVQRVTVAIYWAFNLEAASISFVILNQPSVWCRSVRTRRFQTLSTQDLCQFLIVGVLSGLFWLQRAKSSTTAAASDTLGNKVTTLIT